MSDESKLHHKARAKSRLYHTALGIGAVIQEEAEELVEAFDGPVDVEDWLRRLKYVEEDCKRLRDLLSE